MQDDRNTTPQNWPDKQEEEPHPNQYTEYRILEVGELIQDGDECYYEPEDMWFPTTISYTLTKISGEVIYRRKVEPIKIPTLARPLLNL
jgi:hypothetical protein